ncbi:unnamed protein product, partial [Meganyctiphanes norvegica]
MPILMCIICISSLELLTQKMHSFLLAKSHHTRAAACGQYVRAHSNNILLPKAKMSYAYLRECSTKRYIVLLDALACVDPTASTLLLRLHGGLNIYVRMLGRPYRHPMGRCHSILDYAINNKSILCCCFRCTILAPHVLAQKAKSLSLVRTSRKSGIFRNMAFVKYETNILNIQMNMEGRKMIFYQHMLGDRFGSFLNLSGPLKIFSGAKAAPNDTWESYYSSEGLEYNLGRVPIGGTDFSTRPYTYDDLTDNKTDKSLNNFSLANEDYQYKIPIVQAALKMSSTEVKLLASPWSAPAWMKDNQNLKGKGKLIKEYYYTWALYISRFLEFYKKHNIHFWGLTPQNEPTDGLIEDFGFNSMGWTPEEQAEWIGHYLGPVLNKRGHEHIKIMILDDNRLFLPKWADVVMSNPVAASYVYGIAVHWYTDWLVPPTVLDLTHTRHPELLMLYTEACTGQWPWQPLKVVLGYWPRAESYAADILENLNHWISGWTDWNLALDLKGGPNWAKNYVDSPIIVNASGVDFGRKMIFY